MTDASTQIFTPDNDDNWNEPPGLVDEALDKLARDSGRAPSGGWSQAGLVVITGESETSELDESGVTADGAGNMVIGGDLAVVGESIFVTDTSFLGDNSGVVRVSSSAPSSPASGMAWLDTSSSNVLKVYNGSTWDTVGVLDAITDADFTADGLMTRTAAGTYASRTMTGSNSITVTDGDGVAGAPDVQLQNDAGKPGQYYVYMTGATPGQTKGWVRSQSTILAIVFNDASASSGTNNYSFTGNTAGSGTIGKCVIFPSAFGAFKIVGYYGQIDVDAYSSGDIRFQIGKYESGTTTEAQVDADWGVSGTGNNQIVSGTADVSIIAGGGIFTRRRIDSGTATTDDQRQVVFVQFEAPIDYP